ncbi:MAG: hypothetical protein LBI27_10010, partial [Clostridiales bacterium]|nr:hypothetical protein [Clostridiales bacterium]
AVEPTVVAVVEPIIEPAIEPEPVVEQIVEPIIQPEIIAEPSPEPEVPEPSPEPESVRSAPPAPRARKPKGAKPIRKEFVQEFHESLRNLNDETIANSPERMENMLAVESIFQNKDEFFPFEKFDREIKWVQLTITDGVPLPNNRSLLLEEPFVRAAYANYGHLILGLSANGEQYIIGVPGEYTPDLRPQAKRLGFTKFKTNKNDTAKRGDHGYWLMSINM